MGGGNPPAAKHSYNKGENKLELLIIFMMLVVVFIIMGSDGGSGSDPPFSI